MANFEIGTKVLAVKDSTKGFYRKGMTGVIDDVRFMDGVEYLVKFDGRERRVWTAEESLGLPYSVILQSGDRIVAIKDSPKGFYRVGMMGTVLDYRDDDGGEYKVDFDSKDKKTWVTAANIAKIVKVQEYIDDDTTDDDICVFEKPKTTWGIITVTDDNFTAGEMVNVIGDEFGYYTVVNIDGDTFDVEKTSIFILPEGKPFYVHILDLRKLRELGCEFKSDSGLYFGDEKFIAPDLLDMIDQSFVAKHDYDRQMVTFKYKDKTYHIADWEISNGLIELRD